MYVYRKCMYILHSNKHYKNCCRVSTLSDKPTNQSRELINAISTNNLKIGNMYICIFTSCPMKGDE